MKHWNKGDITELIWKILINYFKGWNISGGSNSQLSINQIKVDVMIDYGVKFEWQHPKFRQLKKFFAKVKQGLAQVQRWSNNQALSEIKLTVRKKEIILTTFQGLLSKDFTYCCEW